MMTTSLNHLDDELKDDDDKQLLANALIAVAASSIETTTMKQDLNNNSLSNDLPSETANKIINDTVVSNLVTKQQIDTNNVREKISFFLLHDIPDFNSIEFQLDKKINIPFCLFDYIKYPMLI